MSYTTAAAIAVSGAGYLAGAAPLRAAATASLPLLLVWMIAAGRSAGRDA
ncbi:hypothetical protein ACU686_14695 [Yinghuangia aomiensis]